MRTLIAAALAIVSLPALADLASLQAFAQSGSPQAKACMQYTTLFSEAYGLLQAGRTEQVAINRLRDKYSASFKDPEQKNSLVRIVTGVTMTASGLSRLHRENAAVAYLEMCRQRSLGLWPKEKAEETMRARMTAGEQCQTIVPQGAGQQNCVVLAFELR
jgi:hypothetical protein